MVGCGCHFWLTIAAISLSVTSFCMAKWFIVVVCLVDFGWQITHGYVVGCIDVLRRFSGISAISRLQSRR